jgi:hypothetical protein
VPRRVQRLADLGLAPAGALAPPCSTISPDAAGIDVGSTFHVVALPGDRDDKLVRTFRTFSGHLHRLADWLEKTGIKTVAMESISVYWIPVLEIHETRRYFTTPVLGLTWAGRGNIMPHSTAGGGRRANDP